MVGMTVETTTQGISLMWGCATGIDRLGLGPTQFREAPMREFLATVLVACLVGFPGRIAFAVTLQWACKASTNNEVTIGNDGTSSLHKIEKDIGQIIIAAKIDGKNKDQNIQPTWNNGWILFHSSDGSAFETSIDYASAIIYRQGFFEDLEGYTKKSSLTASWVSYPPYVVTLSLWRGVGQWQFHIVTSSYLTDDDRDFLKRSGAVVPADGTSTSLMTGTCVKQ